MKLNMNAKEFLAIYNVLYEHTTTETIDPLLKEVFNRMRACIISSLSSRDTPPLEELYFNNQKEKIMSLQQKNDEIKKDMAKHVPIMMDDENDPVLPPEYPRKISMAKGQKKHKG